jgi:hypothetical protein
MHSRPERSARFASRLARADLSPLTHGFAAQPYFTATTRSRLLPASPADVQEKTTPARSPLWDRTLLDRLQQPLSRYRD